MITQSLRPPLLSGRKFQLLKDAPAESFGADGQPKAENGVTRIDVDGSGDVSPGDPELTIYEGNKDTHETVGYDELTLAVAAAVGDAPKVAGDTVMDQLYYNDVLDRPVCTSVLEHDIHPENHIESAYSMGPNGQLFVEFHPPASE